MAFAIAGLFAEGETVITGTECVNTSYPGFYEVLQKVTAGSAGGEAVVIRQEEIQGASLD
ncbi:MAG: hypothetical protein RLZZ142_270 [Verrucomicrobiota bacterium]|jgi:3-phosphoshikimate 1-carboxyvinyltransferase